MTQEEEIKKLVDLIHDVKIAMLTTVDHDGSLRSRPMATQQRSLTATHGSLPMAAPPRSTKCKASRA
jgi:general stress protein 26